MEGQMHGKSVIANEFSKLKQNQKLLAILILFFVCTIAWTVASLFSSQTTSNISPKLLKISKPLNPVLDVEVLSKLEQKRLYTEEDLVDFPIYKIIITDSGRGERIVNINTTIDQLEELENADLNLSQPEASPTATSSATPIPDEEILDQEEEPSPTPSPVTQSEDTAATEIGPE